MKGGKTSNYISNYKKHLIAVSIYSWQKIKIKKTICKPEIEFIKSEKGYLPKPKANIILNGEMIPTVSISNQYHT